MIKPMPFVSIIIALVTQGLFLSVNAAGDVKAKISSGTDREEVS